MRASSADFIPRVVAIAVCIVASAHFAASGQADRASRLEAHVAVQHLGGNTVSGATRDSETVFRDSVGVGAGIGFSFTDFMNGALCCWQGIFEANTDVEEVE